MLTSSPWVCVFFCVLSPLFISSFCTRPLLPVMLSDQLYSTLLVSWRAVSSEATLSGGNSHSAFLFFFCISRVLFYCGVYFPLHWLIFAAFHVELSCVLYHRHRYAAFPSHVFSLCEEVGGGRDYLATDIVSNADVCLTFINCHFLKLAIAFHIATCTSFVKTYYDNNHSFSGIPLWCHMFITHFYFGGSVCPKS